MIKFEDIQRVNQTIRTTNIKGKEYAEVNQRIKAFRMLYPTGFIYTEIERLADGMCVFCARAGYFTDDNKEVVIGMGHAYEKEGSSNINRTSYIENCETSAVGRALGMAGFGIDTSVASYEEVATAIHQQEGMELASDRDKKMFMSYCKKLGVDFAQVRKQAGQNDPKAPMTVEEHARCLTILKEIEGAQDDEIGQ